MTGNPLQPITDYLVDLQGCLMFGRCAGKTTRLSKLHQNRLISDDHRLFQLDKLEQICTAIGEANRSHELNEDTELTERIEAILNLYWSDDDVMEVDEEGNWLEFVEGNPLWPYWYARWFDEEKKQFHVDEDMEVISPSISEIDRKNALEYCEKMLTEGLSDLLTQENLEAIEDGAKRLYDNILLTISHHDAKAEYELIQAKQNIEEKISEQEAYIKERRAELEEFQEAMQNFPKRDLLRKNLLNEFEKEEQHLTRIVEQELESQKRLVERRLFVEDKIKTSMLQAKSGKISSHLARFLTFYESNNRALFGDIPTFIQSIRLGEVPLNDVIQVMNDDGGLVSIIGDPGFGKTIQLRQFTYKLIANQLKENSTNIIPIYVKAKSLSKNIQAIATSPFGFSFGDSENSTEYHGNSTSSKEEAVEIFIQSMLETEPELDEGIVRNMFSMQRNVFDNMYLIIDAYDEILSEDRRMEIVSFIDDNLERHKCPIIMTCRKSHKSELTNFFNEVNGEINTHNSLDIHFTSHELRFEMPAKLAKAWGMNSDQLSLSAANLYKQYETVLTHPLFVGFFCMLLSHDALQPSDSNNPYLKQSKSKNNEEADSTVSLQHVAFLKRVIEFGLEINVKERQSISEDEIARIRKLFCYIAATYITTGLSNLENILKYVAKYHDISPTAREKQILNDNLGVMFVNSEKDIDWTHKTLPEVATGLLILENPDYKDYLVNEFGSIFGRDGELWSECLLITLIQDDLESKKSGHQNTFKILESLFPSMGKSALQRTLVMFDLMGSSKMSYVNNVQKSNTGKFSYTISKTIDKKKKPVLNALMNSYLSMLISGKPFPIPHKIFSNNLLKGPFLNILFKHSNMNAGGLYSDVVIEPLKLKLPDLPIENIVERFEKNLEELCLFYLLRKERRTNSYVCSRGRKQDGLLIDYMTKEAQELPTSFKFSFSPSFDMIISSFGSKRRLDFMEELLARCEMDSPKFNSSDVDLDSLKKFQPVFDLIGKKFGWGGIATNQRNMSSLLDNYPNIVREVILTILITEKLMQTRHINFTNDSEKMIDNKFGKEILLLHREIQTAFGLPGSKYFTLKDALNGMSNTSNSEQGGNFDLIPSWMPKDAFILSFSKKHVSLLSKPMKQFLKKQFPVMGFDDE